MINVLQGIKNNIYINPESFRDFNKSGDLLKWLLIAMVL